MNTELNTRILASYRAGGHAIVLAAKRSDEGAFGILADVLEFTIASCALRLVVCTVTRGLRAC
jgi:hypothetical protein